MAQSIKRPGTRVGDEERHKAAEILSDHHAHGRLSQDEFEDRLGAALTAQTTAELGRLLADLPLRHEVATRALSAGELGGKLAGLTRKAAPSVAALGGIAALAAVMDGAAPYSAHHVFAYAFATGAFGLLAGRATAWIARRRRTKDEQPGDAG